MPKRILLIAALAAAALTLPATAQAADFCVGSQPVMCDQNFVADMNGLASAITAANANPLDADVIHMASEEYTIDTGASFTVAGPTEIIGAGVGETEFLADDSNQTYLGFDFADPTSSISGFSLNVSGSPDQSTGLNIQSGQISDFEVNDPSGGTADNFTALAIGDSATASNFELNLTSEGIGVSAHDGPATIDGATILGAGLADGTGIDVDNVVSDEVKVTRSVFRALGTALRARSGKLVATDTLIDLETINLAYAFYLFDDTGGDSEIDVALERVTVYGNATTQRAVFFGAAGSGAKEFDGTITDSVFEFAGSNPNPLQCVQGNGFAVDMSLNHVAYDVVESEVPAGCAVPSLNEIDLGGEPSQFENAAADDFTPAASSLLIDGGSDGSSLPSSAVDLADNKRLTDGNGDCTAKIDPGAFEFQPAVLVPASCLPPPYVPPAPLPAPPPAAPPATPVIPGATAKLTTRARKAFRRSRSGFRKRTNPRAVSFGITYRNAQIARFELQKVGRGRKKGSRCVRGRRGKRCNFYKKIRGIQRQDVYDGEIFYQFGGRFGGRKLRRGNYRVKVTPFGQGAVRGKPIYIRFKLR